MKKTAHNKLQMLSDSPKHELVDGVRDNLVQRAILAIAILGTPATALAVIRSLAVGWKPVSVIPLVAEIPFWGMVIFRRRISARWQISICAAIFYAAAVGGLLQVGQVSAGQLLFSFACILMTLMFGLRAGIISVIVCALTDVVLMIAIYTGSLLFGPEVGRYARSHTAILFGCLSFIFAGGIAVALVGAVQDALARSLAGLRDRTEELECAVDALQGEIADRARVEDSLLASEARFEFVFNQAAVGIGIQSIDGRWLQANQRAAAIFGYPAEEMVGKSFIELTHPDDLEQSRAMHASLMAGETASANIEKRYLHRDGSVIWTNTYASLVRDKDNRPLFHVVVIEEITERKRVEEEKRHFYREAISSVTDGKLQIVSRSESNRYEQSCAVRISVQSPEQVSAARQKIRDYCELRGLSGDPLAMLIVGFGEAMGNAIKHAGSGDVFAGSEGDQVWVGVSDTGPGIATFALPSATLGKDHTAKLSLGFGYSIMLNVADQIMLNTGARGTRVVLIKRVTRTEQGLRLEDLRDTWDSI